jgi:hypothetical protein
MKCVTGFNLDLNLFLFNFRDFLSDFVWGGDFGKLNEILICFWKKAHQSYYLAQFQTPTVEYCLMSSNSKSLKSTMSESRTPL